MKKSVLVLGATGAMGVYLVPELARRGFAVDAVALDKVSPFGPDVRYTCGDAYGDAALIGERLKKGYDVIIDFLMYPDVPAFYEKQKAYRSAAGQYIFLSTYRVYADTDAVITESSPRLLDVTADKDYRAQDEYALYKAKAENILFTAAEKNWTIVRPAITYSKRRFQLVTLEARDFLPRVKAGKPVYLPDAALAHQATMSWAGDVAQMIAALTDNPAALGEAFTVSTAEHNTWREVAELYGRLIGLTYEVVPAEAYLGFLGCDLLSAQLYYDRCFDRVVDNSKILRIAGLKQSDLMPLEAGLRRELEALPGDFVWPASPASDAMDGYIRKN